MLPCWVIQQSTQKRLAHLVKSCPNDRQVYPSVSAQSHVLKQTFMNVKESGPVRADEFDLQRVDEFGPTSADEDVVQEAEKLKHVLAPMLPSKVEVESDNVSHLPFWFGALRVSMAEDFHLVIAKLTRRRQNRYRLSLWITGSLGNRKTEHMKHKSKGIWSHLVPSKGVTHPYLARAPMADLDFMGTRE